MPTVRFSNLVKAAGAPEEYLVLAEISKDRALQSAIARQQLLTVFQQHLGRKADYGEVGFKPGSARQYLLFPRTLRRFAGRRVVGINYTLMDSTVIKKRVLKGPKRTNGRQPKLKASPRASFSKKIINFTPAEPGGDGGAISGIKRQIRRAMSALEEGKAVAAFNLLKRIVDE